METSVSTLKPRLRIWSGTKTNIIATKKQKVKQVACWTTSGPSWQFSRIKLSAAKQQVMKVQHLWIITEIPIKIKRDVMAFSVQCVIIPLIARHGARKQSQTLTLGHQQHLELQWNWTDSRKQNWPDVCSFVLQTWMIPQIIWLVEERCAVTLRSDKMGKRPLKTLTIHFLLLFQLTVFYNVMNLRRSLKRRDIHTDEAFYLYIDVMDDEEFRVNLHICFRWATGLNIRLAFCQNNLISTKKCD